jgi:uncharacterized protein YqjF (DUF2071 family)
MERHGSYRKVVCTEWTASRVYWRSCAAATDVSAVERSGNAVECMSARTCTQAKERTVTKESTGRAELWLAAHSDAKVTNRKSKVWHGATENGP